MENKWEYDYSGLYNNGGQPAQPAAQPAEQMPQPEAPQPQWQAPAQPPRRKGGVGRVLLRVLAAALAAAICFGAGYSGALLALKQNPQSVVYQAAPNTASPTVMAGDGIDLTAVSATISPSVVAITTEQVVTSNYAYWFGGQYVQSGAGSGVVMTQDGYIITNQHVVSGASNVTVTLHDDTQYTATVVGGDAINDIAVLKIDAEGLVPAIMGDSDALRVGETVLAVGNPMGVLGGTVTNGIISALNRNVTVNKNTMSLIQTNAAVSPGNSGGGLFNSQGQLIGIVNAKSNGDSAEGLGFAIPVNTALKVATDLIDSGYVTGRPALGITVIDITDAQTAAQYGVTSLGVYIATVNEGGAAEKAGLKKGDRVIAVDGILMENKDAVSRQVRTHNVGDTIRVEVARDGSMMTFDCVLGESQG